ncbi:MAG: glycosyltransferase [Woeseiaceae bacterium]
MRPAKIHVVITDFDGWEQTQQCLTKLLASTYSDLEIIVVDHGLSDETSIGMSEFPRCKRLPASSDLWWTGATNVGIRHALEQGASHIMLLNNDCFVEASAIETMLQYLPGPEQIIAPLQKNAATGEVGAGQTGTCFALGFITLVTPAMRRRNSTARGLLQTQMIIGGRGVIIPKTVFDKVGLFDEDALPHYGSDHDFYLRCVAAGIRLAIAADAVVAIDESSTTVARNPGAMKVPEFLASFSETRSHRNLAVQKTMFRRHYPIKSLYLIGVFLSVSRYTLIYAVTRIRSLLSA